MRTNKFTEGFQTIMDSYGTAAYQEVNPGLFAVTTFPFLFAVMFGDIGHGFIIFCAAVYMITSERKLARLDLGEIVGQFFFGRYIILLMGIFSMYTGLMYNDIFSKTLHLWHSGWTFPDTNSTVITGINNGHVYPFGLDPAWHGTENALVFTNSYKMKMSIVLGVIHVGFASWCFRTATNLLTMRQMTFALCLQVPNHIRFKRPVDIYANFIPQMIFFQSIFGYLALCIIYKWSIDWSKTDWEPPSLLNMLIAMFLEPGTIKPELRLYRGQGFVQALLLLLAAVCVPWLLIVKPYIAWREMNQHQYNGIGDAPRDEPDDVLEAEEEGNGTAIAEDADDEHEHHDFGEIVIHQVIHTIEFCLGCISHTASYLRLWALSLAHAQLSEVLWSMTVGDYLHPTSLFGSVTLVAMGLFWFSATVFILCIMEV
ncbi:hypothetical protein DXG03_000649 [Asterophora parasitica]|uniref:V-type proton ATPase subunit a n=1 Tax=Asterophora parasitica TaxID=117018 RepID=A0A9P7GA80_9AGAR|nr:hypothetical protein DXG03_000649 [Asterophora parasitica]